ncbi:hypothetical protein N7457_008256 [Penicillium paradoxum]|uniref:uncharacterized protein n=1 Tax=Penicillium paradoxum TaxID=176176 RepID=UPI002548B717|nr:uncharacterized protein N7457_008256 [Penicillium paradoxum]KAJ5773360.1 hypothetical protein N7457_008256 [Penicillium paradoxum]
MVWSIQRLPKSDEKEEAIVGAIDQAYQNGAGITRRVLRGCLDGDVENEHFEEGNGTHPDDQTDRRY